MAKGNPFAKGAKGKPSGKPNPFAKGAAADAAPMPFKKGGKVK